MRHRTLRISAAVLAIFAATACSKNGNRPGTDSTAAAIADSQPGVNAPSDPTRAMPSDSSLRRDTATGMSLPTDGPNRGRKPPKP